MSNIERCSRTIRSLITDENTAHWNKARDKQAFCTSIVEPFAKQGVEIQILSEVVHSLLKRRAEDMFASYKIGDKVAIFSLGKFHPAKVTEQRGRDSILVTPINEQSTNPLLFTRSRDNVFTRMDGNTFSRIYSTQGHETFERQMTAPAMLQRHRKPDMS